MKIIEPIIEYYPSGHIRSITHAGPNLNLNLNLNPTSNEPDLT